jgi:hypothetical protein
VPRAAVAGAPEMLSGALGQQPGGAGRLLLEDGLPGAGDPRARSSIAGANGWNATAATGCIRVGCGRKRAVR